MLDLTTKRSQHKVHHTQKGENRIMNREFRTLSHRILVILFVLMASGCTLKASTESLTDAMTNFSSSTTPGAWFTVNGLLKPSERINAFLAINFENLRQDMAQGSGEYLAALGTLLDIPTEQMTSFERQAQERFEQIYGSDPVTHQMLTNVVSEIN